MKQRRTWQKAKRVGPIHQLTVIEADTAFPADVFSHSGGCHTIPPFLTTYFRWHFLYSSTSSRDPVSRAPRFARSSLATTILRLKCNGRKELGLSSLSIISPSHTTGYQLVNAPTQSDVVILPPGNCCAYYTTGERLPELPKVPDHHTTRESWRHRVRK